MDVGVEISQYKVIEHIGRGGMADVWSARDSRLNRMVAIKTIAHSLTQQETDPVEMFKREAQTIAQMEHPHILPIYDFGDYEGSLYIVMRYVTGGSLDDMIAGSGMAPNEVLRIAQAIAQALDHAHQNGVIHLDLKPPNILMDSSQSPYVADFGLATKLDPEGQARNPGSGTLLYMAPEQLVAEVIDHRADIYSFTIMLFHMLTGQLPFEGTVPLALKQLQYQENLPDVDTINPNLPYELSEILQHGTAQDPSHRPESLMQVVEGLRSVIAPASTEFYMEGLDGIDLGFDMDLSQFVEDVETAQEDSGLLEAIDIYNRAKQAWQGGQGRFLLGVTHFMLMSGYYRVANDLGLIVDIAGLQMLLRGALEYDHDLDFWWAQLDDDNRRWVCLHTIRSPNAPARTRAFYRLETLPDDPQKPVIPKLVAQALQVETHPEAQVAALQVLGTRSRLAKPQQEYSIKTEYQGLLLTSMTRLGIQITPVSVWVEAVYSPEIDLLVAETALDQSNHGVAEYAARVIGRMRSTTAVRHIVEQQVEGRAGALQALGLVRDEAPSLPSVVNTEGRFYAWIANTVRRVTDQPLDSVMRFLLAMIGGWIAMGEWVFMSFISIQLFTPQRLGNTFAIGLMFGLFTGGVALFGGQLSSRLRGFWPWWGRLLVSGAAGFLIAMLGWTTFTSFYLQEIPKWQLMRMGGLGLVFGFVVSSLLNLRGWQAFLLTAAAFFLPLFASYYNLCQQFYACDLTQANTYNSFSIAPVAGLGLVFGVVFAWYISRNEESVQEQREGGWPNWVVVLASGVVGFGFSTVVWLIYLLIGQYQLNARMALADGLNAALIDWDIVTLLFLASLVVALVATYLLRKAARWSFVITAFVSFAVYYLVWGPYFATEQAWIVPQWFDPYALLSFQEPVQIFTIGIPMALTIALGGHAQTIFADLKRMIGEPHYHRERHALLTVMLAYTMFTSLFIAVFSIFTIHTDWLWAIQWVIWGVLTFVCGLATWQWKKWGARGLMVASIFLLGGGFAADAYHLAWELNSGSFPALFASTDVRLFWMIWALIIGGFTWAVERSRLIGGIGLMLMALVWIFIVLFLGIPGSLAVFAMTNVALMAFVIRPVWDDLDVGKSKRKPAPADEPQLIPVPIRVASDAPPAVPETEVALPRGEMLTEMDILADLESRQTAVDVQNRFDFSEIRPDVPAAKPEADPKPKSSIEEMPTTIDAASLISKALDETEPKQDAKPINLDTSAIRSERKKTDPKDDAPEIKLDTSNVRTPPPKRSEMHTEFDVMGQYNDMSVDASSDDENGYLDDEEDDTRPGVGVDEDDE